MNVFVCTKNMTSIVQILWFDRNIPQRLQCSTSTDPSTGYDSYCHWCYVTNVTNVILMLLQANVVTVKHLLTVLRTSRTDFNVIKIRYS